MPIESIGLISWVALCYSLKFVWSPMIDRVDVPLLASILGRRRAWLLVSQLGVVIGLLGLAFTDPARSLPLVVTCSAFTAFAGATQDIVVDGWRIDAAPTDRQGVMAATYQLGYRFALLSAGAGAFYIAQFVSWRSAYSAMAALMSIGIAAGLAAPRLAERAKSSEAAQCTTRSAFVAPFTDLIRRYGAWLMAILVLVALYRLPDFLTGVMANPLYITAWIPEERHRNDRQALGNLDRYRRSFRRRDFRRAHWSDAKSSHWRSRRVRLAPLSRIACGAGSAHRSPDLIGRCGKFRG